ncbi:MAG: cob(I)yrinic acid a,c-diamide adenosyltransferase [Anaerolineae bacterium]|nr:cob(I)yrinic acid a,c-diamide adenosyltransferase [Anaerolineae bacterium]
MLYTRTGDEGYTSLLGQEKVPKYDLRPAAYGAVDEATAFMGLARANPAASERTRQLILTAQRDLWLLMGELASAPGVQLPQQLTADRVAWLETEIDRLGEEIPPLNQFVLPGDTMVGVQLDVARVVVRRAEREVAYLLHEGIFKNREIIRYLNRLSSLLFALARYEEHLAGRQTTLAKSSTRQ